MSQIPGPDPQAYSQGPLLFFVHKRKHRLIGSLIVIGFAAVVIAGFSWGFGRVARQAPWWAILLVCGVIAFLVYNELLIILTTFHLLRPGPTLILYEAGIHDRRLSRSMIPWSEITRMRPQKFLSDWWMFHCYARNPANVRPRLRLIHRLPSLISQLLGRGTFVVNFHDFEPGADAAMRYIEFQLSQQRT